MFTSKAVVAVVAARALTGLEQNPPELDLFIPRAEEQEIDPSTEWMMVEDRDGLFEADRHTLLALQRMMSEPRVPAFLCLHGKCSDRPPQVSHAGVSCRARPQHLSTQLRSAES